MSYGADWKCTACGWMNLDVRTKCRNCHEIAPSHSLGETGEPTTVAERRGNRAGPKSTPTGSASSQDLATVAIGETGGAETGEPVVAWRYSPDGGAHWHISEQFAKQPQSWLTEALVPLSALTSLRAERDYWKAADEASMEYIEVVRASLAAEKLLREQAEEKANDVAAAWARDAEFEALEQRVAALVGALLWIDTADPEIVAAAEEKFGFTLAALATEA